MGKKSTNAASKPATTTVPAGTTQTPVKVVGAVVNFAVSPPLVGPADDSEFGMEGIDTSQITTLVMTGALKPQYLPTKKTNMEMLGLIADDISAMAMKGRGRILGVNATMVYMEFLNNVIAARLTANPVPLVYAGVLAVAISYTVSKDWLEEYKEMDTPHLFTKFEIKGRKKVVVADAKGEWVEGSDMNASALRVFGSMIVEAGQASKFLEHLKKTAGTIFNPPVTNKPRDEIMKEAAKEVSPMDKAAKDEFVANFGTYASLVGDAFGAGVLDTKKFIDAASTIGEVFI